MEGCRRRWVRSVVRIKSCSELPPLKSRSLCLVGYVTFTLAKGQFTIHPPPPLTLPFFNLPQPQFHPTNHYPISSTTIPSYQPLSHLFNHNPILPTTIPFYQPQSHSTNHNPILPTTIPTLQPQSQPTNHKFILPTKNPS